MTDKAFNLFVYLLRCHRPHLVCKRTKKKSQCWLQMDERLCLKAIAQVCSCGANFHFFDENLLRGLEQHGGGQHSRFHIQRSAAGEHSPLTILD